MPAPDPPATREDPYGLLALQRAVGNHAVAQVLGRRVLARMPTLSAWLDKRTLTKTLFQEFRRAHQFTSTFEAAQVDIKRPEANRAGLKFLKGEMDEALTESKMSDLKRVVDGIVLLLEKPDATIDDVAGYETKVVAQPRAAAAQGGDGGQAQAPREWNMTLMQRTGFGTTLSGAEGETLMNLWRGKLTVQKLDPGREDNSEILKVAKGAVLSQSHIRLDGESVDGSRRYQTFRVQGKNDTYPVLGGVVIQLGVAFGADALEAAFDRALREAKNKYYVVLHDANPFVPPQ